MFQQFKGLSTLIINQEFLHWMPISKTTPMSSHVNYPNVAFRSHVKDGTAQACGLLSPPVGPKWVELILHRKIIISLKDLKLSPTGLKST